jgi:hypothetical protein
VSSTLADYGCPGCGFDGPHTVIGADANAGGPVLVVECGDPECCAEFEVPDEPT